MSDGCASLTEREKQTLRLIVRGHDAKSIARHLDLSVHTVNERLRYARRKLSVSSSREAARLLLAREGFDPESVGNREIGDAGDRADAADGGSSQAASGPARRRAPIVAGAVLMPLALAVVALVTVPQLAPLPAAIVSGQEAATAVAVEAAARRWLELVDQQRWAESWAASATSFREQNTVEVWASVSQKVRVPLGAMVSRTLISQEDIPAPPCGYQLVKFRTSYANKADLVETLSLVREDDAWRVVGIYVG